MHASTAVVAISDILQHGRSENVTQIIPLRDLRRLLSRAFSPTWDRKTTRRSSGVCRPGGPRRPRGRRSRVGVYVLTPPLLKAAVDVLLECGEASLERGGRSLDVAAVVAGTLELERIMFDAVGEAAIAWGSIGSIRLSLRTAATRDVCAVSRIVGVMSWTISERRSRSSCRLHTRVEPTQPRTAPRTAPTRSVLSGIRMSLTGRPYPRRCHIDATREKPPHVAAICGAALLGADSAPLVRRADLCLGDRPALSEVARSWRAFHPPMRTR